MGPPREPLGADGAPPHLPSHQLRSDIPQSPAGTRASVTEAGSSMSALTLAESPSQAGPSMSASTRRRVARSASLTNTPMLDASAFPHLVDRIAHFSPPPTILAIASTSRAQRARLLPRLYAHVSLLTSRDDLFTLRSTAGTALRGHKHRPAHAWQDGPGTSNRSPSTEPLQPSHSPSRSPPLSLLSAPPLPPIPPLPGPATVLDLYPGRSRTELPPGVLALVAPDVVRLHMGERTQWQQLRVGQFMRLRWENGTVGDPIKLIVLVERALWLDRDHWHFDAPVHTLVVHFSQAWCTGYRQEPRNAIPHIPVDRGHAKPAPTTAPHARKEAFRRWHQRPTDTGRDTEGGDGAAGHDASGSVAGRSFGSRLVDAPFDRDKGHRNLSSSLASTPSHPVDATQSDDEPRDIVLIFEYIDGLQIQPVSLALACIVMAACRPHSGETRITLVGDTDDAGWLDRVVGGMRTQLGYYEDARVEFDGACPVALVSLDEYAAGVGAEAFALETDPAYRYMG